MIRENGFLSSLSAGQRRLFMSLSTPEKIQRFIDGIRYHEYETYHCPLTTMKTGEGCCFEGALLAAAALAGIGHRPPRVVTLIAEGDDDHVLAVYKKNKCWGALAKSKYPSLRSRQPVYRTLRELVMSYFEFYFNPRRRRTLRGYSIPLDLRRFDGDNWMINDKTASRISDALDSTRHLKVVSTRHVGQLPHVDKWLFAAEMRGVSLVKKRF